MVVICLITNPEVVENLNLIDNSIDYLKVQGDIYEKVFLSNLQFSSKILTYAIELTSIKKIRQAMTTLLINNLT